MNSVVANMQESLEGGLSAGDSEQSTTTKLAEQHSPREDAAVGVDRPPPHRRWVSRVRPHEYGLPRHRRVRQSVGQPPMPGLPLLPLRHTTMGNEAEMHMPEKKSFRKTSSRTGRRHPHSATAVPLPAPLASMGNTVVCVRPFPPMV
jgi:hypothetical protein